MTKPSIVKMYSSAGIEEEDNDANVFAVGCIVSDEFLERISKADIKKYISSRYVRWLIDTCTAYYQKYGKAPRSTITELLETETKTLDPVDIKILHKLISIANHRYVQNEDSFDWKYTLDKTEKYFQKISMWKLWEDVDPLLENGNIEEALELINTYEPPVLTENIGKAKLSEVLPKLAITFQQLEEMEFKKKGYILLGEMPLERDSVTLVSGPPGAGKSWFVSELAKIATTGGNGLAGLCHATDVTKTLIVDGELPLGEIVSRSETLGFSEIRHLSLLSKSLLEKYDITPGLNLTDEDVRQLLSDYLEENKFELLILDNIFSLFGGQDLDSAEEWSPVNDWLLSLRSKGISTIIVHHTNKAGKQMGTHSRTFNINNHLLIQKEGNEDEDICCFSVKVEKQRGRGIRLGGKKFTFKDGDWSAEVLTQTGRGRGKKPTQEE